MKFPTAEMIKKSWKLQPNFEVLEQRSVKEERILELKRKGDMPENELLALLLPHVHITSFREILPSMNDIFIQVVGSSNSNHTNLNSYE